MKQNISSYLWCCKTDSKQVAKSVGWKGPEPRRGASGFLAPAAAPPKTDHLLLPSSPGTQFSVCNCPWQPPGSDAAFIVVPDLGKQFLSNELHVSNNNFLVNYCLGDPKLRGSFICSPGAQPKDFTGISRILMRPWVFPSHAVFPPRHLPKAQRWNTAILMVIMSSFIPILRMKRLYLGTNFNILWILQNLGFYLDLLVWLGQVRITFHTRIYQHLRRGRGTRMKPRLLCFVVI